MIFNNAENKCVIDVLKILNNRRARYSEMFKETKVSHTTLQKVLRGLEKKKFISKSDLGYVITADEGKKLLRKLEDLRKFLR